MNKPRRPRDAAQGGSRRRHVMEAGGPVECATVP